MALPSIKTINDIKRNQNKQMDHVHERIIDVINYCTNYTYSDLAVKFSDINAYIVEVSNLLSLPYNTNRDLSTWNSASAIWPKKSLDDFQKELDYLWIQLPDDAKAST